MSTGVAHLLLRVLRYLFRVCKGSLNQIILLLKLATHLLRFKGKNQPSDLHAQDRDECLELKTSHDAIQSTSRVSFSSATICASNVPQSLQIGESSSLTRPHTPSSLRPASFHGGLSPYSMSQQLARSSQETGIHLTDFQDRNRSRGSFTRSLHSHGSRASSPGRFSIRVPREPQGRGRSVDRHRGAVSSAAGVKASSMHKTTPPPSIRHPSPAPSVSGSQTASTPIPSRRTSHPSIPLPGETIPIQDSPVNDAKLNFYPITPTYIDRYDRNIKM